MIILLIISLNKRYVFIYLIKFIYFLVEKIYFFFEWVGWDMIIIIKLIFTMKGNMFVVLELN
jgi:hypothetical protein